MIDEWPVESFEAVVDEDGHHGVRLRGAAPKDKSHHSMWCFFSPKMD